jgi:transposase InsO family protein
MESFLSLLQKNVPNRQTWPTRQSLRIAIVTWIERTYHRRRRQAALGRFAPRCQFAFSERALIAGDSLAARGLGPPVPDGELL